jgi:DNA-binding transcriptional LysR family regulator
MQNLDLDVLRSFVTGIELGSFAKAADRLGRSTSAISAQMKKLEEQFGTAVLKKSGRGLVLTPSGETVLSYARRLLELNDAALMAVRGAQLSGALRIGFQEDFGEGVLTDVLGRLANTHPGITLEARIARNQELEQAIQQGQLDIALLWQAALEPSPTLLGSLPMQWIGHPDAVAAHLVTGKPLPLVTFDAPCLMRSRAIAALDTAGIPWRIAFTSTSLSGIWSAVNAGLGITVRTTTGMPTSLQLLSTLPTLPPLGIALLRSGSATSPALEHLAGLIQQRLLDRGMTPMQAGGRGATATQSAGKRDKKTPTA